MVYYLDCHYRLVIIWQDLLDLHVIFLFYAQDKTNSFDVISIMSL